MQAYWLLKTEPGEYAWEDMLKDRKVTWDGIRAPAALKNLAQMQSGDMVFIYHTGVERAVQGIARVEGSPYPDPDQSDPRFLVVDLVPAASLLRPVTLKRIKESGLFPNWELVRQPRLSVVPVSQEQWQQVLEWVRESN